MPVARRNVFQVVHYQSMKPPDSGHTFQMYRVQENAEAPKKEWWILQKQVQALEFVAVHKTSSGFEYLLQKSISERHQFIIPSDKYIKKWYLSAWYYDIYNHSK